MRIMLKSKIHRARITGVNIDYEGSITPKLVYVDAHNDITETTKQAVEVTNL